MTASSETPICTFSHIQRKTEALVSVTILPSQKRVDGIFLTHKKDDLAGLRVYMPKSLNNVWNDDEVTWSELSNIICDEYLRVISNESAEHNGSAAVERSEGVGANVFFKFVRDYTTCVVGIKLPNKRNTIKDFRLKRREPRGRIALSTPRWIENWENEQFSWQDLCDIVSLAFEEHMKTLYADSADSAPDQINSLSAIDSINTVDRKKDVIEKTDLGRIKNAKHSSFRFFPRTVLRLANSEDKPPEETRQYDLASAEPKDKAPEKKSLENLGNEMKKGSKGGIGPFEISLLVWIEKLRFVARTMLLDLISAGYVSTGWRNDVTGDTLYKSLDRMSNYNLIDLSCFATVDDVNNPAETQSSAKFPIATLGKTGSILLRELGKEDHHYNMFEIFQDGNTVKRKLAANQWLVYWLTSRKESVKDNYKVDYKIQRKGSDFSGARVYALVSAENRVMIAEPARRVEDFETSAARQSLREKLSRMIALFDNMDQLYDGMEKIDFPSRPIIVYVCEDDDHIREIYGDIKDIAAERPEQTIWFSADLRIYNFNYSGRRFLTFDSSGAEQIAALEPPGKA